MKLQSSEPTICSLTVFYAFLEGTTSARLAPHKNKAKRAAIDKMVTVVSRTVDSTNLWSKEYEDLSKMDQNTSTCTKVGHRGV